MHICWINICCKIYSHLSYVYQDGIFFNPYLSIVSIIDLSSGEKSLTKILYCSSKGLSSKSSFIPRSRGQADPHDLCAGGEPSSCLRPSCAMMRSMEATRGGAAWSWPSSRVIPERLCRWCWGSDGVWRAPRCSTAAGRPTRRLWSPLAVASQPWGARAARGSLGAPREATGGPRGA